MLKGFRTTALLLFLVVSVIAGLVYLVRLADTYFSLNGTEISLVAAILGGFISGGMTLIGVRATLDNQSKEKFIEMYPKRKIIGDKILDLIYNINNVFYGYYEPGIGVTCTNYFEKVEYEIERVNEILEETTIINSEIYKTVRLYRETLITLKKMVREESHSDEIEKDSIGYIIEDENLFGRNLAELVMFLISIETKLEELDNKYLKLTGI